MTKFPFAKRISDQIAETVEEAAFEKASEEAFEAYRKEIQTWFGHDIVPTSVVEYRDGAAYYTKL
jgi:hypothetical protein